MPFLWLSLSRPGNTPVRALQGIPTWALMTYALLCLRVLAEGPDRGSISSFGGLEARQGKLGNSLAGTFCHCNVAIHRHALTTVV